MRDSLADAIRQTVDVPAHVKVAAGACAADLLHGPHHARLPDSGRWEDLTEDDVSPIPSDLEGDLSQVYTGPVGELLREYIAGLETLYVDQDDTVHAEEPQAFKDEDGDVVEPTPYSEIDHTIVLEALFGATISREFR